MTNALWQPSLLQIENSHMFAFMQIVNAQYPLNLQNYSDLYQWSINSPADFWQACSEFCDIQFSKPYSQVLQTGDRLIDARWFVDGELNFAQHLLRHRNDKIALIGLDERNAPCTYTYNELYLAVAHCAQGLKDLGVQKNDVIAGFLPNIPETIIAMLATTSLGAIWTACSPDFGAPAVLDRFSQVSPKILFTVENYLFKGKTIYCTPTLEILQQQLPNAKMISVQSKAWQQLLSNDASKIDFVQSAFNHPLYILYSSGTTGAPKCIVHGAGGTLIQHLKELILHTDLRESDTLFYYTTCSWMMWHWMTSALAVGATVLLYEGAPLYPDFNRLWQVIATHRVSVFGTSAKYLDSLAKENFIPKEDITLLHTILSTGAPLLAQDFEYVYRAIKPSIHLASISGGTDIISCFGLGCPLLPVYAGELQCKGLGMQVEIYNEAGQSVHNEKGELVCSAPFPSMPIYFWNDDKNARYLHSYFAQFPHVWTHGDFAQTTLHGGLIIYGRSDSVLKRGGVRIGSAEIYRVVASIDAVLESLVIGRPFEGDIEILLFVILREGVTLDDALRDVIMRTIRLQASPRHVPDRIIQVTDLPRTMNGKVSESAVRQVVMGESVNNKVALMNAECLGQFLVN